MKLDQVDKDYAGEWDADMKYYIRVTTMKLWEIQKLTKIDPAFDADEISIITATMAGLNVDGIEVLNSNVKRMQDLVFF